MVDIQHLRPVFTSRLNEIITVLALFIFCVHEPQVIDRRYALAMDEIVEHVVSFFGSVTADGWFTTVAAVILVLVPVLVGSFRTRSNRRKAKPRANDRTTAPAEQKIKPEPLVRYFAPARFDANPLNVIIETHVALEGWFDRVFEAHNLETSDGLVKLDTDRLASVALHQGIISQSSFETARGLKMLREFASAKGGDRVEAQEARKYVTKTDALIWVMDAELSEWESKH